MATINEMDMMAAALEYVRRGWAVLPLHPVRGGDCGCGDPSCSSAGKHPLGALVPKGLTQATTDETVVRDWWTLAPDANIGVRTGVESGLVVLDVDPRHGGDESLTEL